MKRLIILTIFIICLSCKKNNERNLLYDKLLTYRDELKMRVQNQEEVLYWRSRENEFYKKTFDSLNKINTEFERKFESIKYGERKKIMELRNSFNDQYKLRLNFEKSKYDESIPDSVFFRLIEIDVLRLIDNFQNQKMFSYYRKSY